MKSEQKHLLEQKKTTWNQTSLIKFLHRFLGEKKLLQNTEKITQFGLSEHL